MTNDLDRRQVLKAISALGFTGMASPAALAQTDSIAASTFPGSWEEAHRTILIPAFRKATNGEVSLVASPPADTLSKLVAARGNPPFDVVILDEGPSVAAPQAEIFEKIPADRMSNMKDMPQKFIDPRGFGVFISAQICGIAYNTEKIKTPPTSWSDFLKPEYKGRVGMVPLANTMTQAWMVEIARLNGGNEENLDPAFQFVKKMQPNLGAISPTPGALATLFQQGQIDIAVHYNNNVGDLSSKGVPIALAKPDTGFVMIRSTMHIARGTKKLELAAAYINEAISPAVQTRMGEAPYFLVPTNSKVPFSTGLQKLAKNMAEVETFHTVDWAKFNTRRIEYIDRFNRETSN